MTNSGIAKKVFGDEDYQCMWQISPKELPKDMNPVAFELFLTGDGTLHLIQMHVNSRADDWYSHIDHFTHFKQVK